jgi:hypothetical protein
LQASIGSGHFGITNEHAFEPYRVHEESEKECGELVIESAVLS